jgi:membrane protease YdiL (CAAX protease family)
MTPPTEIITQILTDTLLILIPIAYYTHKKKQPKKELNLQQKKPIKTHAKNTLKTLALLLTTAIILTALLTALQINDIETATQKIKQIPLTILIYLIIIRSATEEIFFRGLLTPKTGALGSSIIFALAHSAYNSHTQILGTLILGYILAKRYQKTQDIYSNIIAHIIYNTITITVLLQ